MTKGAKIRLVLDLMRMVQEEVISSIRNGDVPEEWTGLQLRQLLADKFKQCVIPMTDEQRQEYDSHSL